jgi:beta-carotene 3-hydroxylase
MTAIYFIAVLLATFLIMEGITWLTHKYIMHGLLWYLHRDHHQKEPGFFEIHDVIIHQRFKWFTRSNNTYVRAIRWAHKMHHKHLHKEEGESFGMLYVHKKYWEKVRKDKKLGGKRVAYAPEES